jgi:undecaprenyl-diphosphatase
MSIATFFDRADRFERRMCIFANSATRRGAVRETLKVVSRLGDGVFWYALMAAMPLLRGRAGLVIAAQMMVTGAVGFAVYKGLKKRLVRERPFVGQLGIECVTRPLDRYSFPSGHTLHAVLFSVLALAHVPELGALLVPMATLIAVSRVVLGLHYPSDVLVGAGLGAAIAMGSLAIFA